MSRSEIITGLDIGSSTIKLLVVAKKSREDSAFEILFKGEEPSLGVRRGVILDPEKVARIIQILVDKATIETGHRVNSLFANIGGSHLFSTLSQGMIAVSRADRNISKEDVERVLEEAAKAVPLSPNSEILETIPREFIIDGNGGIKEAEGLQGNRLETEILVLSSFSPYKKNLIQAAFNADLHILDITPSVIADSSVVLSQKQKELGAAVLNIGGGTSELAVFEEGDLTHFSVLPIGSSNITYDIAVGLKIDVDLAETIKLKLGSCNFKGKDKKEKIEIESGEPLVFSQKSLAKIVEARVSEIFEETNKELKKISKQSLLPAGLVLTGGGSCLPKIIDLAKKELKLPCRLGKITPFPELEEDLSYATVCGLVYRGFELEELGKHKSIARISGGTFGRIKKIFKNFLP